MFDHDAYEKEIASFVTPDEANVRAVVESSGGVCGDVVTSRCSCFIEKSKVLVELTSLLLEVYNYPTDIYAGKHPVEHILLSTTKTQRPLP